MNADRFIDIAPRRWIVTCGSDLSVSSPRLNVSKFATRTPSAHPSPIRSCVTRRTVPLVYASGVDERTGLPVVGMVGAGQLARMTHQAAIPLGQSLRVLADTADDGAALVI